jgi:saccharopine dehydrogenase-like NADP-dependent oxidoreductase
MKVVVAGGAGLTGQCAVRDLLRSKNVEKIMVADYESSALEQLSSKLSGESGKLEFKKVDVRNHDECSSTFRGYDVIINAVQYYFNLDVMAIALETGLNYLDFGGLYHTTLKQIDQFDDKFRAAGLLAIVGMGAQPGVSNLMVKYALASLDRASSVEILDGWRDLTKINSPLYFTWSPQTFFDESSLEAIVLENGKYQARPAFSEPQTVKFPEPVGSVDVYVSLHSELATIPKSFESYGIKNLVWKEGGADFWKIKFLADLGLTSNEKISIDGLAIAPRKFLLKLLESKNMVKIQEEVVPDDYEITRVIAKGSKDGEKKTVIVDAHFAAYKPWKVSCSQYNVGIPGSIAAQMLASNIEKLPKGVLPAEQVFEPLEFFKELEKRKIQVIKRLIS